MFAGLFCFRYVKLLLSSNANNWIFAKPVHKRVKKRKEREREEFPACNCCVRFFKSYKEHPPGFGRPSTRELN